MEGIVNNGKKIIGIVSAKGGVGKTTTAINIGASVANMFKKSVLILDTNINTGNLGLSLGLTYHPVSMYSIIKDSLSILHSVHKHRSGLHIIPSSLVNDKRKINPSDLNKKLNSLNNYDLILLDSAPGTGEEAKITIKAADSLLLIITPDFPTLGIAIKTIELAKRLKVPVEGVIINKVKNKRYELSRKYIERTLGLPVVSVIPEDNIINESLAARMPIVLYKQNSKPSRCFRELSAMICGKKVKKRGFIDKIFGGVFRI